MRSIIPDLHLESARLRARPGHFVTVGVILALGIGASTAIFTLVDATLFRPFDLPEGDRLVRINSVGTPAECADPTNQIPAVKASRTDPAAVLRSE